MTIIPQCVTATATVLEASSKLKKIVIKGPGLRDPEWAAASDGFNVNTETLADWPTQLHQYSVHTTPHWLFLNNQEVTFGIPTGHGNQTIACTPINWGLVEQALETYGSVMFGYYQAGPTRPDNVSIIDQSSYWARTQTGGLINVETNETLLDQTVVFTSWLIVYGISSEALYCVVNSNLVGIRSDIEGTTSSGIEVSVINGDTTLRNSLFRPTVDGGTIVEPNIIYTNHSEGVLKINTRCMSVRVSGTAPCTVTGSELVIPINTLPLLSVIEWQALTNSDLDVISTPESNLNFKFVIIKS